MRAATVSDTLLFTEFPSKHNDMNSDIGGSRFVWNHSSFVKR